MATLKKSVQKAYLPPVPSENKPDAKQQRQLGQIEQRDRERLVLVAKWNSIEPPCRVYKGTGKNTIYGLLVQKFLCPGGLPQFWVVWDGWSVPLPEQVNLVHEDW